MDAAVKALTSWRRGRDSHTREVVKHETRSELPDEVKALLIRMNARIEAQGQQIVTQAEQVAALRKVLDLLRQAATT